MGILSTIGGGVLGGMGMNAMDPTKGYKKAMEELQKAWQQAQSFQQPYNEAGQQQIPFLNQMRDFLANPEALQSKWAQGYETSPYAQDMMKRARDVGMNEASSMGLMGSSGALENLQRNAGSIMQEDRQRYLDDLMKKYMASIGIGENIFGTGAATAGNMGNQAVKFGENMGGLAYGKANAKGQMLGNLIGMGANLAGKIPGLGMF
jgi:hypothetical protein